MAADKPPKLTHIDTEGAARMVDVGQKAPSKRVALAEARVRLNESTLKVLADGNSKKGDVLAAARIAGIQAAKRTADLIPLCHTIPLTHVTVELHLKRWGVHIVTRAETIFHTGVEMEAMTAASVAALTIYDMMKSVERGITIEQIRLLEKAGGQTGVWTRPDF